MSMYFQYAFLLNIVFLKFTNMGIFSPNIINFRTTYAVGEGDGTPLQHSCLETPMDGGAW